MVESAEAESHDIFHGLQLKCHDDSEMLLDLQDFLMNLPGYGEGTSDWVEGILEQQRKEMEGYLFR